MEYVSKACPFCGGTQLIKEEGAFTCAYCLQPLDVSNGELSDGYNKLASHNFAGAAAFFREKTHVGAEAYYGLFLATKKIEEGKTARGVFPTVYGYYPAPFSQDADYAALREMCAPLPALRKKLDAIENARRVSTEPRDYNVLVAFCERQRAEAEEFSDTLEAHGFRVYRVASGAVDTASLRAANAAYAFLSDATELPHFAEEIGRKYLYLENAQTERDGLGKKPMKTVCRFVVSDMIASGVRDVLEIVPQLSLAAELRRLRLVLHAGQSPAGVVPPLASAPVVLRGKRRDAVIAAAIKNEAADLERVRRSVAAGDFAGALRLSDKMERNGCGNGALYLYAAFAETGAANAAEFTEKAAQNGLTEAAVRDLDTALYRAGSTAEAQQTTELLVNAAKRAIDRKKPKHALQALQTAFRYDPADPYAASVLDRLHAAKNGIPFADYFALHNAVAERTETSDAAVLAFSLRAADDALSCGEYGCAADFIDALIDRFPAERGLYARAVCAANRVPDLKSAYATAYPRLKEPFVYYLAARSRVEAQATLREAFAVLCASTENGFDAREAAIDEVLALGSVGTLTGTDPFFASDYCAAGEAALQGENYEAAHAYFAGAVTRDPGCYAGYWGALKAAARCSSDKRLEECETPLDEIGGLYDKAYRAAYGRDDAFLARIEDVRTRRNTVERQSGHVYRKEDFTIKNGVVVRYSGRGTENVYVAGGATAIGPGAFRGADAQSVILADTVTSIGSGAFAYAEIRHITLPERLTHMGANPFCGCAQLKSVTASGRVRVQDGCLCIDKRLVAYLPQLRTNRGALRPEADTVGAKAFYGVAEPLTVRFGFATAEPCAFYDCAALKTEGNVQQAAPALFGEGSFVSAGERWPSLYGGGDNNMAADGDAIGDGREDVRKLIDTRGPITGGILYKNGRAICAEGNALYAAPVAGGADKRAILPAPAASTGVLWREYVLQPAEKDGCTLFWIDEQGNAEFSVRLGRRPTRPLCLSGDTLLCCCADNVYTVDLCKGTVNESCAPERITSVPCAWQDGFLAAGEKSVYAVSAAGACRAVCELSDTEYAAGQGKICRGRIVSYGGAAYWIERDAKNVYLRRYDGRSATRLPFPRSIVDFMQTQPVFYRGMFYGGAGKAVISARTESEGDWNFCVCAAVNGKYAELAVVGGVPYVNGMEGQNGKLRLRAAAEGKILLTHLENGGVYVARI